MAKVIHKLEQVSEAETVNGTGPGRYQLHIDIEKLDGEQGENQFYLI